MNGGSLAAEDVSCGFFFAEHEGTRQAGSLNEEEFAAALQDILVAMVKEHYAVTRALSFLVIQSCFVPFFSDLGAGRMCSLLFLVHVAASDKLGKVVTHRESTPEELEGAASSAWDICGMCMSVELDFFPLVVIGVYEREWPHSVM